MTWVPSYSDAKEFWQDIQHKRGGNQPRLSLKDSDSRGEFVDESGLNRSIYRVKVENVGDAIATSCTPKIQFEATARHPEDPNNITGNVSIDTPVRWSQTKETKRSLRPGEYLWVDIYRLTDEHPDDRGVEFPTIEGWNERARIQFRHLGNEASRADRAMSLTASQQMWWERAELIIQSDEDTFQLRLDFEDMNKKMDANPPFVNRAAWEGGEEVE